MKNKYFVIGDEDTVLGFRAAGISGQVVGTKEEVVLALARARKEQAGIVIIPERTADLARQEVDAILIEEDLPLVVEIPGPEGAIPGRRTLEDAIHEAIGIKV